MKRWLGSLFVLGSILFGSSAAHAINAITTTSLNMRTGPGTRYAVRTAVPSQYPLQVRTCVRNWCQINYRGYTGWVSARYLAFKQAVPAYRRYAPVPTTTFFIGGPYWGGPRYYHPRWHHRGRYWGHRGHYRGHRGGHWHHRGSHWGHRR